MKRERLKVAAAWDQSLLAELEWTSEEQASAALARAHAVYSDRSSWLPADQRIEILERLAGLVEARSEQLALQASREGGKPLVDSRVELRRAKTGIQVAARGIAGLVGQEVPMGQDAQSRDRWALTFREPRGVVLAISAFNHPFNLLVHQAITAIAAGCPVVVKPALATPLSCISLLELLTEAGLPADHCQMIVTPNEVTARLVGDSRLSFLSFIGSSRVGWMLKRSLAPRALGSFEHGGVAPVIIDETADLDAALPLLLKGAFYHAGQVCVSVQRVFVHRSRSAELADRLAALAAQLVVGDPTLPETEVGPLIRPEEVERVEQWVEEAVRSGGRVATGGVRLGETSYAPTVVVEPADDVRLSQQEVFGPVVCIYPYDDIEHAVCRANLEGAYFQAALFTNRLDRALVLGRRLHGTSVMINDHTAFRVDWMPFGGHRDSGLLLGGVEQAMHDMTLQRMIVFRQAGLS